MPYLASPGHLKYIIIRYIDVPDNKKYKKLLYSEFLPNQMYMLTTKEKLSIL